MGRQANSSEWSSSPVTTPASSPAPKEAEAPEAVEKQDALSSRPWSRANVLGALENTSELHPADDEKPAKRAVASANPAVPETPASSKPRCGSAHEIPMAAGDAKGRVALTLRVDHDRHMRLRLLAAQTNRSSQDILMAALDDYIINISENQELCDCLKPKSDCGKSGFTAG